MMQNHLEISSNTIFGPETCEINPKVLRKVDGKLTESWRFSKTWPGGPTRAHMGPYGPQPGPGPNPDWAPCSFLTSSNIACIQEQGRQTTRPRQTYLSQWLKDEVIVTQERDLCNKVCKVYLRRPCCPDFLCRFLCCVFRYTFFYNDPIPGP